MISEDPESVKGLWLDISDKTIPGQSFLGFHGVLSMGRHAEFSGTESKCATSYANLRTKATTA